jgi:hypothetical protein
MSDLEHEQHAEHPEIVDPGPGSAPAAPAAPGAEVEEELTESVSSPAKVMRIGSMIKQLLDEVRAASLDEAGRDRLKLIYEQSVTELSESLSPDLRQELAGLVPPFAGPTPTEAELRIAQAQLVGWLEGLFHGIQATLFAQQMAARQQLEQIRGQLPPGQEPGQPGPELRPGTYL